jgi:hypothetical protein
MAVATASIQDWIAWDGAIVTSAGWLATGLRFGFGAVAGDAAKSFFKRRLAIAPGSPWIPFDQLDFAVGALVLVGPAHRQLAGVRSAPRAGAPRDRDRRQHLLRQPPQAPRLIGRLDR